MPGVFYSRFETALRVTPGMAVADGRLQGSTAVTLRDTVFGDTRQARAPYQLFGPKDVQRLAAGTITRRFPAPGAWDAEETKLALVEFGGGVDLPWRYTPAPSGLGLAPWLVLVVGRRTAAEITLRPDGRVGLGLSTQSAHPLSASSTWAHVHEVDGRKIARIVSPVNLAQLTEYVACVVKAFRDDGTWAWNGGATVTVDCYDSWTFRTGPEGDFPQLAGKLRKAKVTEFAKPFGRAEVAYASREDGDVTVLAATGALRLADGAADPPVPAPVAGEVAHLSDRIVTPDGRGVVTAPRYDAPFTDPAAGGAPTAGGWIDQLRTDPRLRGAAGLGAWTAIEWQDRISDAAAAKAGDLATADDRIRHVALGVEVSRSLWRRRVPVAPADRLAVLAPVLGRLAATGGGTVLERITGRTPDFTRALLTSAGRRAARTGPARAALARKDANRIGALLEAAAECPDTSEDPADIRPGAGDPAEAVKAAVFAAADDNPRLASVILDRLGENPDPAVLAAALRALSPALDGQPDRDAVDHFLNSQEFPQPTVDLESWPGWIDEKAPPEPCRGIPVEGVSTVVCEAVDPTVARPPAVVRVLATLPGITHIGPIEIEPELDLPLWSFLSEHAPDWMLPGVGDLKEHTVVGLGTNPAFVQSLLTGANHQTTGELRWRNIPMTSRWTPLRKFWQRAAGQFDVDSIKGWPAGGALGDVALGGHGAEAVVAFRTPLFRRYPDTVVYLYKAAPGFPAPKKEDDLAAGRIPPTFTGTIGSDVTFFGFAVKPAALQDHWVVMEEPPAGYRFYHQDHIPASETTPRPAAGDDSAQFAYKRFATPVRVLIGPLL